MRDRDNYKTEHANQFYIGHLLYGSVRVPLRVQGIFLQATCDGCSADSSRSHLSDMSSMAERFEIPFFEPSGNPTIASKTCPWSPLCICAQPLYVQFLFVFTRLSAIRPFLCMLSHCILLSGAFDPWHGTFRASVRHGTVLASHSYAGYYAPTGPASYRETRR